MPSPAPDPKDASKKFKAPPKVDQTSDSPNNSAEAALPTISTIPGGVSSQLWMPRFAQEFGGVPPALIMSQQAALFDPRLSTAMLRSAVLANEQNIKKNSPGPSAATSSQFLTSSLLAPPEWLQQLVLSQNGGVSSRMLQSLDSQLLQSSLLQNQQTAGTATTTSAQQQQQQQHAGPRMPAYPPKSKKDRIYLEEPGMWDVKCGRGGDSNHHPGNKRYRQLVADMKIRYRATNNKAAKTDLSRSLLDYICNYGGRFIKKDGGKYYLLSMFEARKKTSQALRETKKTKWTLDTDTVVGQAASEQVKEIMAATQNTVPQETEEEDD